LPASTILLLESATTGDATLAPILTSAGYTVTRTTDVAEAVSKVAEHQLVAIDVGAGVKGKTAFEMCHDIRAAASTTAVPILCVAANDDVEERISFLEAGADDVVARPFDAREVEARVEALLLRFQRSRDLAPVVSPDGLTLARPRRSVAVYSPKGGVGTTTIATNVAVAAAQRKADRVVLVDLDLQFGAVATHLNIEPKLTIADVVRDETSMREPELIKTYIVRHDSGLHVLAAPMSPEASELVTADHVEHILGTLLEGYDAVVVDAGSVLDERALRVFEAAETLLLPVHPEISSLKAVAALLEYLNETGSVSGKSTFVLNNMFAREILKPRDIESALGARISTDLPYDSFLYLKAVNEGVPIVLGAPRSPAAEQLVRLSTSAFGSDGYTVPQEPTARRQRRFGFGRRS
jgi:pilus assembly protein CpaE